MRPRIVRHFGQVLFEKTHIPRILVGFAATVAVINERGRVELGGVLGRWACPGLVGRPLTYPRL